jgi:hypothetical protein
VKEYTTGIKLGIPANKNNKSQTTARQPAPAGYKEGGATGLGFEL